MGKETLLKYRMTIPEIEGRLPARRAAAVILAVLLLLGGAPGDAAAQVKSAARVPAKAAPQRSILYEDLDYNNVFFLKKRDPIFAGMLSWYVPGLGQFYSAEYVKGTVFLVTEYSIVIGALFYFMNFDFSAGGGSGLSLKVDARRTDLGVVETSRKNVFIGLMAIAGMLHLYNVSDAVMSARDFNSSLDRRRQQMREKYPEINFDYEQRKGVSIGIRKRL
ncbi:MAG: hypothetical protein MUC76_05085 [Spirochaetes bacterium]|nr:hypothetical protein [Spirochaetota bacterium]